VHRIEVADDEVHVEPEHRGGSQAGVGRDHGGVGRQRTTWVSASTGSPPTSTTTSVRTSGSRRDGISPPPSAGITRLRFHGSVTLPHGGWPPSQPGCSRAPRGQVGAAVRRARCRDYRTTGGSSRPAAFSRGGRTAAREGGRSRRALPRPRWDVGAGSGARRSHPAGPRRTPPRGRARGSRAHEAVSSPAPARSSNAPPLTRSVNPSSRMISIACPERLPVRQ
jgi:hypothetical protein